MVTAHRIAATSVIIKPAFPVQSVESFLSEHSLHYENQPLIAEHSLPLRVVYPKFDNGVRPECILDGGAQVVVMRRDIWECLDLPLMTEKVMIMESANNTWNPTLGVVQNIRLSFGPIMLTLHIQVVDYAPFEVLLRRPFFAISSCITEGGLDGDSFITLRDPNTGERAKFVTHA